MQRTFEYINPRHLDILSPLVRWKILSLQDLYIESKFKKGLAGLYKAVQRLERDELLHSFRDSWSKEKFLYLGQRSHELLGLSDNQRINPEQKFHDALTVKITKSFLDKRWAKEAKLDFEMRETLNRYDYIPDAALFSKSEGYDFCLGLELELTQKTKERILSKLQFYSKSDRFNHVLFIFYREGVCRAYQQLIQLNIPKELHKKFIFVLKEDLSLKEFDLEEAQTFFDGKEFILKELFQRKNPM
jgi:hypothetical protein